MKVTWEIDIDAGCATQAALIALEIMQDMESTALCFTVEDDNGVKTEIDLQKEYKNECN